MAQKFKPTVWARQEALEALVDGINEANAATHQRIDQVITHVRVLEQALLKTVEDIEALSEVLADAGLLVADTGEPDEIEDNYDRQDEVANDDDGFVSDLPSYEDERRATEAEVEAAFNSKADRVDAVRRRRARAAQEQGITDFEQGNESPDTTDLSPEELANSTTSVPEEGVTVLPGRDPHTGEPVR